jgi:hypothetical protein
LGALILRPTRLLENGGIGMPILTFASEFEKLLASKIKGGRTNENQ